MTEDEMVGWHHPVNGREFEQSLGNGEGQGSLACCSTWGRQELDMTEQLNNNKKHTHLSLCIYIHQCNKMYLLQEMVTHSSILAWKILMVRQAWQAISPWGGTKSQTQLSN